jgi:hypothetical protein
MKIITLKCPGLSGDTPANLFSQGVKNGRFGRQIRGYFWGQGLEYVSFFGLNLVRAGSHINRPVRMNACGLSLCYKIKTRWRRS